MPAPRWRNSPSPPPRPSSKATSYNGEPVIIMEVGSSTPAQAAAMVLVETMQEAGFKVDEQAMDWGTVLPRRAKKDGWSLFAVYSNGTDMVSPLTHFYVAIELRRLSRLELRRPR